MSYQLLFSCEDSDVRLRGLDYAQFSAVILYQDRILLYFSSRCQMLSLNSINSFISCFILRIFSRIGKWNSAVQGIKPFNLSSNIRVNKSRLMKNKKSHKSYTYEQKTVFIPKFKCLTRFIVSFMTVNVYKITPRVIMPHYNHSVNKSHLEIKKYS